MIFLDFLRDKTQVVELEEEADRVLEELTGLKSLRKQFDHVSNDVNIMFHKAHNHHHEFAHIKFPTTSQMPEFQIPDLLFVSDSYLRNLPKIYDIHLFKKLAALYECPESQETKFLKKLQQDKDSIERLCFLINASEILSKHIEENKTEYCQEIADNITQKNIESMGSIRLKIKSDSGSQR